MSEMHTRFLGLFVVVSALTALGVGLLVHGAGQGQGLLVGAGGAVAVLALIGIVVLARFVIASERAAGRR